MINIEQLNIGKEAALTIDKPLKIVKSDLNKRYVMTIFTKELPNKKKILVLKYVISVYDKVNMRNVACSYGHSSNVYGKYLSLLDYYKINNTVIKDRIEIENFNLNKDNDNTIESRDNN